MGSFLVAFATVSRQQLVGLALGSRWGRPSPLAVPLAEQVEPPNGQHHSADFHRSLDHFWVAEGRQEPSGTGCRVYFPLSYVQGASTRPALCLLTLLLAVWLQLVRRVRHRGPPWRCRLG